MLVGEEIRVGNPNEARLGLGFLALVAALGLELIVDALTVGSIGMLLGLRWGFLLALIA